MPLWDCATAQQLRCCLKRLRVVIVFQGMNCLGTMLHTLSIIIPVLVQCTAVYSYVLLWETMVNRVNVSRLCPKISKKKAGGMEALLRFREHYHPSFWPYNWFNGVVDFVVMTDGDYEAPVCAIGEGFGKQVFFCKNHQMPKQGTL